MPRRLKTDSQRRAEERERLAQVARALMEAEPAEAAKMTITLHVPGAGEQLPRIPVVGMEAGAIRGTTPHRHPAVLRFSRPPKGDARG
jgi:hypothetical protein